LIVAAREGNSLFYNDGHGIFVTAPPDALPRPKVPEETWKIAVGDVNGDGYPDIFFANTFFAVKGAVLHNRLLINDGAGRFRDETSRRLPREAGNLSTPIARFVSLEHDGILDIVLGSFRDDVYGRRHDAPWRAYLNDGKGFFSDATKEVFPPTTTGNGRYIEVADINQDGIDDLYLCSRGGPSLLLLGKGPRNPRRPHAHF
jgi:hypothetical protein